MSELDRMIAEVRQWRDDAEFDLRETLRAVLHFWGPEGAQQVTRHVMMARRSRDSNAQIDELEKLFAKEGPRHAG